MPTLFVRIPEDRVGVLLGVGGSTKREIERRTGTSVSIDASDDAVQVSSPDAGDPIGALQARDVALAIGRGFSPLRAFRLLQPDTYLAVLDIKEVTGKRDKAAVRRIRARVIGVRGRARERIEELSGCAVSVYGSTVALIGQERQLERAQRAVQLLLRGSEHNTVFRMLVRGRREDSFEELSAPSLPELTDGEPRG
ncbi:MAG: KH domain-containing protein [Thermoplasmata archaeon]|nr:KH domain-containing protein [Thermoplasmata archaeon]